MCWMTVRRGGDALADAVRAARRHEDANRHSWGWAVARGGELVIEKGTGRCPHGRADLPVGEAALAHVRFATVGEVTEANAHPFAVERGGGAVAALAHNGTWRGAPDVDGWSDSRAMAAILGRMLRDNPGMRFCRAFRALGELTGETLAALHRDGTCYVHSGRFVITRSGPVVASSGLEELGGGVHVVEPGAEARGAPADD
jgi:hypothetical protein